MNQPEKQNTPKRSKRKPVMQPLGWDEIVSQPGMGGYLSFLNGPIPLPHLQGAATGPDPGVVSAAAPGFPGAESATGSLKTSPVEIVPAVPGPEVESTTRVKPPAVVHLSTEFNAPPQIFLDTAKLISPQVEATPAPTRIIGSETSPHTLSIRAPGVIQSPEIVPFRRLKIRRCLSAHDGHSLGEEVLYQSLWKAATVESPDSRTIIIGWRGMSQLCRMTPKNCKINTQRLIRKLALEVLSPYNTPESIGTTYRVYSAEAIQDRRRTQGLEWVVRSRGVEFVDPVTGESIAAHMCGNAFE
ncbi:MAG: hypothetical protein ABSH50_32300 [Bryobacteraceae bacterium]